MPRSRLHDTQTNSLAAMVALFFIGVAVILGVGSATEVDTRQAGCPKIIPRAQWGARAAKSFSGNMPPTPHYIFIHHGASAPCHTEAACAATVRSYQNYHMDTHGWSDIGYSFIVGEDGNVYEGRGWKEIGAHTLNYNSVGIGICMIGDFTSRVPNDAGLNAVKALINCAVNQKHVTATYTLRGHRDMPGSSTECPGTQYYNLIKKWPHY